MGPCKFLSIVGRLLKLFRRRRQSRGVSDESSIAVDPDQVSQTPESSPPPPSPSVGGDSERHPDDVQQDRPPLPPSCNRLQPGDVTILGDHASRAGTFTDIWDGLLGDDHVVVKSYRTYSTVDPTQARMVRLF